MKKYILSIDQGTTGSRAFVFDARGSVISSAYQEFKQYYPKPGGVEHDAEEIWQSVDAVIRKAVKKSGIDPKSIDKNGNLSMGFREHISFPEIFTEKEKTIFGLEITVVTNAKSKEEGLELYKLLGFPMKETITK